MKQLICIFFSFIFVATYAQEYRSFRLSVGIGGASVNKAGGPALSFEPAYRLNDNIVLGYKVEGAFILGGTDIPNFIGSQSINGQYYFSNNIVRPFLGAGAGIYNMSTGGLLCDCETSYEKNKIGFYPRAGFDFGHLTFNVEYNFMTPVKMTTQSMLSNSGSGSVTYQNVNYFTTKVALSIGGGKKK